MNLLTEENILIFLLQIALLLGCARALGELFRRFGQPSITAEILVGIFFGPTIFGRLAPDFHAILFPDDPVQIKMLGTVAWLGILLFLLKAGLETNFATAWRQRRKAMALSACDLTLPMIIAFFPCLYLPARYMGEAGSPAIFALFVAVIMTISALPVTARVLQDLKIYRTDLGLLIMSALTINDVAGWVVFALILGFFAEAGMSLPQMGFVLVATLAYAALSLSVGSRLFDGLLRKLLRARVPEPAGSLTLVVLVGLIGGAVTTWIGIHALFGFFIAGIMAGESKHLSERTRRTFDEMVTSILVPIFFTAVGLKLDFLGNFDPLLVSFILGIGIVGRYVAAYLGSRFIGQPSLHSRLIADAHIPGGEMQIIIGMLALEYGVIAESTYVAIVFGAIATSVISPPLMGHVLRKVEHIDWLTFLPVDRILPELEATEQEQAIRELCERAEAELGPERLAETVEVVLQRERQMSTSLEEGIAIPHARIEDLRRPIVVFGRSPGGVPWNSADGKAARLICLVLTPKKSTQVQLQILRGISQGLSLAETRMRLLESASAADILTLLRQRQIEHASEAKKRNRNNRAARKRRRRKAAG